MEGLLRKSLDLFAMIMATALQDTEQQFKPF